jgi:hypothetical protein
MKYILLTIDFMSKNENSNFEARLFKAADKLCKNIDGQNIKM